MKQAGKNALLVLALAIVAGAGIAGGAAINTYIKAHKINNPTESSSSSKKGSSYSEQEISIPSEATIIGVTGEASVDGTLTRTGQAVGLSYTVDSSTGTIQSDFDDVFPYSLIHEVEDDSHNVFVSIPKHYTRYAYNPVTYKISTQISDQKLDGFALNPVFLDTEGNELNEVLIGKYQATGTSELATSVSGASCLTSVTHEEMRTACVANGEGYQMLDIWAWTMLQDLFKIEFATTDSQSVMRGNVEGSKQSSGTCDAIGENKSGWDLSSKCMTYRGIENLYGNVWQWMDGMTFSNHKAYVCYDPAEYESGKTSSPYVEVGYLVNSTGAGNSSRHGFDPENPFVQLSTTCSNSDYDNGGYWYDYTCDATAPCPGVGGGYENGSAAGLWSLDYGTLSSAYGALGGRLLRR